MKWKIYKSNDLKYLNTFWAHGYTRDRCYFLHKEGVHLGCTQYDRDGNMSSIYRFNSVRDLVRKFKQFADKNDIIINRDEF